MPPRARFVRVLLFATFLIEVPCVADADSAFRPVPPFQPTAKNCLSVHYGGAAAYWVNHCPHSVAVRWSDDAECQDWRCQDEVPANASSTAAISRHVRWCECPGALSTCKPTAHGC